MGRWLHFVRKAGAEVVGMDVRPAIDMAAVGEGDGADFVQAGLRWSPFPLESFDMVYNLGVLNHLENPQIGVRALANLVRPGGELRLYVYRALEDEPRWKRALFGAVTGFRQITTRLPYPAVHPISWLVAAVTSVRFLWPRRFVSRFGWGGPAHAPSAPRALHRRPVPAGSCQSKSTGWWHPSKAVQPGDAEGWLRDVGFEVTAILPGLGGQAIGKRPSTGEIP